MIILLAILFIIYYLLLPFILQKVLIAKIAALTKNAQASSFFSVAHNVHNVVFLALLVPILTLLVLYSFLDKELYINNDFIDYFYGSMPLFITQLNLFAGFVLLYKYLNRQRLVNQNNQSFNLRLHNACYFIEFLIWLFFAYNFIATKDLWSIIYVTIAYSLCKLLQAVFLKLDGHVLIILLSANTCFFTLLHLFFIDNIFATLVLFTLYSAFNYFSQVINRKLIAKYKQLIHET